MPLYRYEGLDSTGKKKSGIIESQGEKEAKDKLREMGVYVSKLEIRSSFSSRQNLKGDNLLTFTVQLSQLVNAGVPLYESLIAIEEQYRNESFHRILLSLCEQIKAGASLSVAMSGFPESFNKLYCSMVAAGESVGALGPVLEKLSQFLDRQMKLKKEISTALIYPAILATFSLVVISMLLGFVVPSIEGIFASKKLNSFTQFILDLSHFYRNYWWVYLPLGIGLLAYVVHFIRSPRGKVWMQINFLRVPLIRTLMIQASVARFCRTMATLQIGGLPMIDSLRISREVMGNVVLEEEVKKAEGKIVEGSSLGVELSQSKWFPLMVSRMLTVGEEAGGIVSMLNKIAEMYEDALEKTLDQVLALAQPVILIFMGTIIGTVLLAILLPLTNVSSISM